MGKAKIRVPFFETSVKNYIFGDAVLEFAMAADRAEIVVGAVIIRLEAGASADRIASVARALTAGA